jgi:hypothetical protein
MLWDYDSPPDVSFHELKLAGIEISTKNISREDGVRRERAGGIGSYLDHHYFITSVPVYNPAAVLMEQAVRWLAENVAD